MGDIVPAAPAARRVRELLACGLTINEIASAAGQLPGLLAALPETGWISRNVDRAIKAADLELMGPPPPRGDVDEIVVERLIAGDYRGPCTRAERLAAVRHLRVHAWPAPQIARQLHMHLRQVQRDLAALGLVTHRKAAA